MPTVGTEKPTVVFWPPSFVGRWVDWGEVGRGFYKTTTFFLRWSARRRAERERRSPPSLKNVRLRNVMGRSEQLHILWASSDRCFPERQRERA